MEQASGDRSLELRSMVDAGDVYSIEAESKAMKWTRSSRKYGCKKESNQTNLAIFEYKEARTNAREGTGMVPGLGIWKLS